MAREPLHPHVPLYPHMPKSRQPQFPHTPKGQQLGTKLPATKKPTRNDVRVEVWEERDRLHIGIQDRIYGNYYANWWDNEARQMFEDGFFKSGKQLEESVLDYAESVGLIAGGKYLAQTKEKLYQRGADGYPIRADKIMRDAWGTIPDPDQPFWSGKGFIKPVKIYGWQWSPDYHSWRAYVRFPDGTETWTSPLKQTGGSLELLASTEGDPIRKFCCRQCGECAPTELLAEGRFLDRISWLRSHYEAKHPGMWGTMSPMTVEGGGLVPPEYRHLVGLISEPLPKDAY